jgi:hypothetical protein
MTGKQAQGYRDGYVDANDSNLKFDEHLKVPYEISSSMGGRVHSGGGRLFVQLARTRQTRVLGCTQGPRVRRGSCG